MSLSSIRRLNSQKMLGLLLCTVLIMSAQGQCKMSSTLHDVFPLLFAAYVVTMRWQGRDITGVPTLIYHDELVTSTDNVITDPDGQGSLICSTVAQTTVSWMSVPGSAIVTHSNGNFKQTRAAGPPSLSQLTLGALPFTTPRTDTAANGLWSCSAGGTRLCVGLYGRVPGMS